MFANFTEETCTGTGDTLALSGAATGMIPFSESFADGDLISYVLEDSAGTIKIAGVGTYVAATDDITRDDSWSWNGTVVDKNPSANIVLSGGNHTIRCDVAERNAGAQPSIQTWLYDSSHFDYPDNINISGAQQDIVSANDCTYAAAWLQRPRVINNLAVYIPTADVASTVAKAGIYTCKKDGGVGRLIESVDMDVTTTGIKTSALVDPRYFPAGWYYTAFASNGSPTVYATRLNDISPSPYGFILSIPRKRVPKENLANGWLDLPANANATIEFKNYAPIVAWS